MARISRARSRAVAEETGHFSENNGILLLTVDTVHLKINKKFFRTYSK